MHGCQADTTLVITKNSTHFWENNLSLHSTLQPEQIVKTVNTLEGRIEERFPDSSLRQVCHDLAEVSEQMVERSAWIGKPILWLRVITWAICIGIIVATTVTFFALDLGEEDFSSLQSSPDRLSTFVTLTEAAINDVLLIGAAIFFIFTIEKRYKRTRALKALHELRSIAHIIDMHQLTKDPHRVMAKPLFTGEGLSPKLNMTSFQLRRYLDYCSEMLALTGKIAAVYVQQFDDAVAIGSASELEALTSGLSNKIWQKILILESYKPSSEDQQNRIVT